MRTIVCFFFFASSFEQQVSQNLCISECMYLYVGCQNIRMVSYFIGFQNIVSIRRLSEYMYILMVLELSYHIINIRRLSEYTYIH